MINGNGHTTNGEHNLALMLDARKPDSSNTWLKVQNFQNPEL